MRRPGNTLIQLGYNNSPTPSFVQPDVYDTPCGSFNQRGQCYGILRKLVIYVSCTVSSRRICLYLSLPKSASLFLYLHPPTLTAMVFSFRVCYRLNLNSTMLADRLHPFSLSTSLFIHPTILSPSSTPPTGPRLHANQANFPPSSLYTALVSNLASAPYSNLTSTTISSPYASASASASASAITPIYSLS